VWAAELAARLHGKLSMGGWVAQCPGTERWGYIATKTSCPPPPVSEIPICETVGMVKLVTCPVSVPNQPSEAHMRDWLARTTEIIDKYKPEVLWFDWRIEQPVMKPYLQKLAAYYYNRGEQWKGPGVAINYKNQAFPEDVAVLDIERRKLDNIRALFWQTDTSVSIKSWGYIENDQFRTPVSLIDDLISIVSKNGSLLHFR